MNKFTLSALLGATTAMAVDPTTSWTAVDDPRCHPDPHNPVIPPTPTPTPTPPAPTPISVWDPPATTTPPPEACPGAVIGFAIYDVDTGAAVLDLVDGMTVNLDEMPDNFTVEAVPRTAGAASSGINMYFDETFIVNDAAAPYLYMDMAFPELYTQGTYSLMAFAQGEVVEDSCGISITIDYNNQHVCEGIVTQLSLFNTVTQDYVENYEVLTDGQILTMADLPDEYTIVAKTNGRGNGVVHFGVDGVDDYHTSHHNPNALTGKDANGDYLPSELLHLGNTPTFTIYAYAENALGAKEAGDLKCEISLTVEQNYQCPNRITGYTVWNHETGQPLAGFQNVMGARTISLNQIGTTLLAVTAERADSTTTKARFYVDGHYKRQENYHPFAINGDSWSSSNNRRIYWAASYLSEPGTYVISARGGNSNGFDAHNDDCRFVLTIDNSWETIDNDEHCAPEQIVPALEGQHIFHEMPVEVVSVQVNETVKFKTKNTIWSGQEMGWVTTGFVTQAGVEVCDKINDMAYDAYSEHTYEVKCFDGFAFADVWAYSANFMNSIASADTTTLPQLCKDNDDKVVKYTIVFSCDCDNISDIPDEIIGGPDELTSTCSGDEANSWGDPHVTTFNNEKWNCQGEGEFVLSKAELDGYSYDFELRARFTRYGQNVPWSFNSAMVARQGDLTVQISIGETQLATSNMYDDVPINFIVNGEPRLLAQGSGDHRVRVTLDREYVHVFFTETGIKIDVRIRAFASDWHGGIMLKRDGAVIPGSFSTYLCYPGDNTDITNVMGLLGSPDGVDYMDSTGAEVAKPWTTSAKNAHCKDNWCIDTEADSFFTFESGYGFDHYNLCNHVGRHLEEDVVLDDATFTSQCMDQYNNATACDEMAIICDAAGDADDTQNCREDAIAAGFAGAKSAVETLADIKWHYIQNAFGVTQDDAACCSSDFATCIDGCSATQYKCSTCFSDDGITTFLPHGSYFTREEVGHPEYNCKARKDTCITHYECCGGQMTCEEGVCIAPVGTNGRRLAEKTYDFVRPDVDMNARNMIPLHTEL